MKHIKKVTLLLTAALIAASAGAFAACGGNDGDSSSLLGSSSQEQSSSINPNLEDDSLFVFPEEEANPNWFTLDDLTGTGHAYMEGANAPYRATTGYFEVELTANGVDDGYTFFNFSIPQSGQYALYTLSNTSGVTVINYPYSAHYVNLSIGEPTHALKSGKLYCLYNMSDVYFNSQNAFVAFAFQCTQDTTLKFRFVRVGEPINPPEHVVTDITAQEIRGKASVPDGKEGSPVAYDTPYFFDENATISVTPFEGGTPVTVSGFYRMGTPQNPGEIIYAALNAPNRLIDIPFADIYLTEDLVINVGIDEQTGNYLDNDYRDFITNDKGTCDEAQADLTFACYENACNADGYYPVNAEIYAFLQNYLISQSPYFGDEYEEGEEPEESTWWLSVCYYYKDIHYGTAEHPFSVVEGENPIELESAKSVQYYNFKTTTETVDYIVSCEETGVYIVLENTNYAAPFALAFTTDDVDGITFSIKSMGALNFTVCITPKDEFENGTEDYPYVINIDDDFTDTAFINGSLVFTFTAPVKGKAIIANHAQNMLTVSYYNSTQIEYVCQDYVHGTTEPLEMSVAAGITYTITITAQNDATTISPTFTFQAE